MTPPSEPYRVQMARDFEPDNLRAYRWGVKAAQAGLTLIDNPYFSPAKRGAWGSGYRFGSEASSHR